MRETGIGGDSLGDMLALRAAVCYTSGQLFCRAQAPFRLGASLHLPFLYAVTIAMSFGRTFSRTAALAFAMAVSLTALKLGEPANPSASIDPSDNALAAAEPQPSADAHARNATLGEEFLAENVREVRRRAAGLAPKDRFDHLADLGQSN